ncbi:thioesterase family protein [Spirochaetota bacterium]
MNTEQLKPGLTGQKELVVSLELTASHLGSGGVPVFATPMMVLAMEEAARAAVDSILDPGFATVGYHLDIKHLAPTSLGKKVTASAKLLEINGKLLSFRVEAHDENGLIGEGSHVRAIINIDKFKEKLVNKKKN